MASRPPYRRRRFFLPETSQPRLLLRAHLATGAVVVLLTVAVYVIGDRNLGASYYEAHLAIRNVRELLLPVLVVAALFGFILNLAWLVFYTHRIAGPLYRLTQVFRQVRDGHIPNTVRFRQGDLIPEIAEEATEAFRALRTYLVEARQALDALEEVAATIPEAQQNEAFRRHLAELRGALQRFELDE